MATAKFIREALEALNLAVVEASTLGTVLVDLAGPNEGAPQWPFLVDQSVRRIDSAAQRLESLLRQKALPLIEDMDRVTR